MMMMERNSPAKAPVAAGFERCGESVALGAIGDAAVLGDPAGGRGAVFLGAAIEDAEAVTGHLLEE